ncbi:MAG TPA: TetR family transcriptional regulator [Actinomycetota bacterium]|nr:TetR family transcriptional regulator [Actinomycetota bacterium]
MMARSGRRPGPSGTREAILRAARRAFHVHGYDGATIRGIAAAAGVDPALVHHFYGSKEQLFAAAMEVPFTPSEVIPALLEGGAAGLGERILRFFLAANDRPEAGPFVALIRSASSNERAAAMLRGFIVREVIGRLAGALGLPHAELRASLVGSQLAGLAMARYVLRVEPLASADPDTVVAWVAPTLQRYLTGELPRPAPGARTRRSGRTTGRRASRP